jgi:hypothetical protein
MNLDPSNISINSLLIAIITVAGAYTVWRMRALTIWRETAAALQANLDVEKEARHKFELKVTELEGELKALRARPDYAEMLAFMRQHSEAVTQTHKGMVAALDALARGGEYQRKEHESMIAALNLITGRLDQIGASS